MPPKGHKAAQELAERADSFAENRSRWPALKQARIEAATRMAALDAEHDRAVRRPAAASRPTRPRSSASTTEEGAAAGQREHEARRQALRDASAPPARPRRTLPGPLGQRCGTHRTA